MNLDHELNVKLRKFIGNRMRVARILAGYNSQSEFGELVGYNQRLLSRYENGNIKSISSLLLYQWSLLTRQEMNFFFPSYNEEYKNLSPKKISSRFNNVNSSSSDDNNRANDHL